MWCPGRLFGSNSNSKHAQYKQKAPFASPSCFSDDSVPNNVASMISLHGSTDESDAGLRPSAWLLVGID